MIFPFLNYRGQENSRLVYLAKEHKVEIKAGDAEDREKIPHVATLEYDEKLPPDENWTRIDEAYGKDAYTEIISRYADTLLSKGPAGYRDSLVNGSVQRYLPFYEETKLVFMSRQENLDDAFEESVETIVGRTKDDLAVLRSAVEGSESYLEFSQKMPSPENKGDVKDFFDDYLEALNGRYFNPDVHEGKETPIKTRKQRAYLTKAGKLQDHIENWVTAKLEWLLSEKGTKKSDLMIFQREIGRRYQTLASLDGNSSIISERDFDLMEKLSRPPLDTLRRILRENDDQIIARLEILQMTDPDRWEELIELAGNSVINAARMNGSENEFLATMRKYRQVDDYDDAVSEFTDLLEEMSQVGPRETIKFLQEFNMEVHSDVLSVETSVKPPAFAKLVSKQLSYLLSGLLVPHKETDRTLVRFMTASREDRNDMLHDDRTREVLFRGIRTATQLYPDILVDRYGDDLEKVKRSRYIENPTHFDRAAQLKALIVLGQQAEMIVEKLEKAPEHRKGNYMAEMQHVELPDKKVVRTGLRFASAAGKPIRYRSALERGGFNTRDLALKGGKMLGALMVLANVAQSWSETEGDFVDRVFETGERALTNHGVLAGAAVTVGTHMAERDPRLLKYPWLSEHERDKVRAGFKLRNIAARLGEGGRQELSKFLNTDAEWRALDHPQMTSSNIRDLLRDKGKKTQPGLKPTLSIDDIAGVIRDERITSLMRRSNNPYMTDRARYLFYQKFFGSADKPEVSHVKEICIGSSHIQPIRVDTEEA